MITISSDDELVRGIRCSKKAVTVPTVHAMGSRRICGSIPVRHSNCSPQKWPQNDRDLKLGTHTSNYGRGQQSTPPLNVTMEWCFGMQPPLSTVSGDELYEQHATGHMQISGQRWGVAQRATEKLAILNVIVAFLGPSR